MSRPGRSATHSPRHNPLLSASFALFQRCQIYEPFGTYINNNVNDRILDLRSAKNSFFGNPAAEFWRLVSCRRTLRAALQGKILGSGPLTGRIAPGMIAVVTPPDKKTLGDILFADKSKVPISEDEWLQLVRAVAGGDQRALHSLYEQTHRIVFTLIVRITANRETAEEVTLDVFYDVWRKASTYDPANGSVVGWIMNQARSRAIDRLRFDQRKKRVNTYPDSLRPTTDIVDPQQAFLFEEQSRLFGMRLRS